jgi:tRNA wybutosine-synthesizing protein 4
VSDAKLVVGDIVQVDNLLFDLERSGLNLSAPTVILLECVLSYVDQKSANLLLSTLASRFSEATLIMYDPVLPYSNSSCAGLAFMMHQKFNERQAPLLSCAQSAAQYMNNLRTAGWMHVTAMSVNQASKLFLSAVERKEGTLSEPFDEFASLALLQNYYAVGIASTQSGAFQRTHELLYASKISNSERTQAVEDRVALAEMRLMDIVSHIERRKLIAPLQTLCNR